MIHLLFSVFSYFIPINPMNCNLVIYLILFYFNWVGLFLVTTAKMCGWKLKSDWKKKGFGEVYLEMVRSSLFMA